MLPISGVTTKIVAPLVILHDIGYSVLSSQDPFGLDIRQAHMKVGAEMAAPLMSASGYDQDTIAEVCRLILIHDVWALGESEPYRECRELAMLNDLDFTWMVTTNGFAALCSILGKTSIEFIDYLGLNEKLVNRPFVCVETESLFMSLMAERKLELKS
jgi:hypothetical protein